MRIAIFCETYLPFLNGVVTHIKLLKEGLEKNGHQVLIVTGDPDTHHHYLDDQNVLHCPGIRSNYFYGYGLALPRSRSRMKYLEEFNPDICHIHQEFGVGLFGLKVAKEMKKPAVYTLHTMYDDYLYYVAPSLLIPGMRRISHTYFGYFAKHATSVTGPSIKSQEYLTLIGIPKKVSIIPNPVELDEFYPNFLSLEEKEQKRAELGISKNAFVGIFVGRVGKEKSIDILLENWAKAILPEDQFHLLVIGDGPVLSDLKKQADQLGILDQVTFTGKVEHGDLLPYYSIADVYITASLSDTYSISMLEGNATGLPTIQQYDELNKDQVIEGKNGFTFTDANSMANVLRKVRDFSTEDRFSLKSYVLDDVQKFSSEAFGQQILKVYEEALSSFIPPENTVTFFPKRFKFHPTLKSNLKDDTEE